MSERFRGESLTPQESIERSFGTDVARVVERLAKLKEMNFDSLMGTLQRMLASEDIEISEDRFEELKQELSDKKRELGLERGEHLKNE